MNLKPLLKKWPSVSTAAAMLLGLQQTEANTPEVSRPDRKKDDPFEPLILAPPKTKTIPEHLFAGHQSHSSHSSGSSGRVRSPGGSGGYYTPSTRSYTPAPKYVPSTPRPSYSPSAYSTVAPRLTATPVGTTVATVRIDLTNGAVIYGQVLVKSAAGITFTALDGKNYKVPRLILSAATISALRLPATQ